MCKYSSAGDVPALLFFTNFMYDLLHGRLHGQIEITAYSFLILDFSRVRSGAFGARGERLKEQDWEKYDYIADY